MSETKTYRAVGMRSSRRRIDVAARIAAETWLRDYVEKTEAIASLLREAAKEVVKARSIVKSKRGISYEGPEEVKVAVEHENGHATITAKYGDKIAKVELDVKEMGRYAVLANLAAAAIRDVHGDFVRHFTSSPVQAADRLLMWAVLMPGEYALIVRRAYMNKSGISPIIWAMPLLDVEKLTQSPIYRLLLRAAGTTNGDYILAAAWAFIASILATPEGGRPSNGAAALAEKGVLPPAILNWLRPHIEELDELLGQISTEDKAFLIAKMADYNGRIAGSGAWRKAFIKIDDLIDVVIKVDGDKMYLLDLVEAAAKAFSEKGGVRLPKRRMTQYVVFYDIPPVKGPAIKIAAAVKVEEKRLEGLFEYGESIRIGDVEIVPVKAKEEVIDFTEETMKKFDEGYYTYLRLVAESGIYDLRYYSRSIFVGTVDEQLAEALKKIGARIKKNRAIIGKNTAAMLSSIGIKAYAVRKAKNGDAKWIVRIGAVELRMNYDSGYLQRKSKNGKIPVIVNGKPDMLDLKKLAAGEGGIEKAVVEALNKAGIKWRTVAGRILYIRLPPQVVRTLTSDNAVK